MYEKIAKNSRIYRDFATSYSIEKSDLIIIANLKTYFVQKYGKSILQFVREKSFHGPAIPLSVFSDKLSMLETIVKYLREDLDMSLTEIARLTKRGLTTISTTYKNAVTKHPNRLKERKEPKEFSIPVLVISNRKLSTFEAVVMHLKYKLRLRFSEIANYLNRENRIIWKIHSRALKKVDEKTFINEINNAISSEKENISVQDISILAGIKHQLVKKYNIRESLFIKIFEAAPIAEILSIPVSVFWQGISPLRAVVIYFKDELNISLTKISKILNRSLSLISASYKEKKRLVISDFNYSIPANVLSNRRFSIMESVAHYLIADYKLTLTEASKALNRNPSIVWKLNKRYLNKNEKK